MALSTGNDWVNDAIEAATTLNAVGAMNTTTTHETTINDVEQTIQNGLEAIRNAPLNEQIIAALKFLTPHGYRPIAQLEEDGRKKRSNAAASNWNPETGEIVIYFERAESTSTVMAMPKPLIEPPQSGPTSFGFVSGDRIERIEKADLPGTELPEVTSLQIQQCCVALADAEKAGKAFIALKWFRDNDLMARDYRWTDSLALRQAVLTKAIEIGAVLTTQIPNPKAPQHPTTTVKLNRESKYAQAVAPRFQPIKLRGEGPSASELLLRDRERF